MCEGKIYYNGSIITMEGEEHGPAPESILVSDGIIKAVGSLLECQKRCAEAEMIDLEGKCLMPSFIDAHGHMVMNGQMALCADLSDCTNFDDIIHILKEYIKKNCITEKNAVIGFGYDHNFLSEHAHPDKHVLDQISTEIPIMIMHISAHLACVNSALLSLVNIDANTPNPPGGIIGRIDGTNEPNGYLEEAAMMAFSSVISMRIEPNISEMLSKMQDIYLENGVTTVQDGASTKSDIDILKMMSETDQLKVDVIAYPIMPQSGIELMCTEGEKYRNYYHRLKIGGYKLVLDGSPQGRSAWMSSPYLGENAEYCGYPWMEDTDIYKYVLQAVRENRQLLAHCNGDAASEQYLNAYEKAVKATGSISDLRPVMIHCQTVRNDQLDRMAKLKMIASIFVGHVWYWGDVHLQNFGEKRGHHISPAKDALERGVCINFHQDAPVTKPKMLHSVWCAVNRLSRKGRIIGEDQKLTVYEALKAVTINAAYEYFEEDSKGSIRIGKRADLVILDKSPLDVDPMEIKDIAVLETIKDGQSIYKKIL